MNHNEKWPEFLVPSSKPKTEEEIKKANEYSSNLNPGESRIMIESHYTSEDIIAVEVGMVGHLYSEDRITIVLALLKALEFEVADFVSLLELFSEKKD